jgi:beta-glucosidase
VSDETVELRFPDGFVWGTATAAHQVEGGNWNNDWWAWEHDPESPCAEPSGDACDQYHRYPGDLDLLAALGFGSYRFSVEWSRVEPEDGELSRAALDHYRRVLAAGKAQGLQMVVTLHHFTTPRWVAAQGGWVEPATGERFVRYARHVAEHLGDLVDRWCTFNEPNIVATMGYLAGVFPPGQRDRELRRQANQVFIDAHRGTMEVLRDATPDVPAGLTLAMSDYQAVDGGEAKLDQIRRSMEDLFLEAATFDDFVGVQTYSRTRVGPEGQLGPESGAELTLMGYEFYPEALEATIRRAWEVTDGTPVLVTENGIGTDRDDRRIAYVDRALRGVGRCLADGIDVLGYTYWSLLDNFEWALGYVPRSASWPSTAARRSAR